MYTVNIQVIGTGKLEQTADQDQTAPCMENNVDSDQTAPRSSLIRVNNVFHSV